MAAERKRDPAVTVGEVFVWLLFFALLVPAGVVGWAIGHSSSSGRTVTRTLTVAAPATSTSVATTSVATTTKTTPASSNSAKGKSVFLASACASCHTFKPAGTSGTIGPDLDTKPEADAKRAHMSLAAFVRESIVKPNAYISPGYPKGVMPQTFATQLSKKQLADLVAFLTSNK